QVGQDGEVPFLAMELLQGEPLDRRLKRGDRFPPAEVARIGCEVAEGLAAAHAQGLIHRDIKPANIWLEETSGKRGADALGSGGNPLGCGLAGGDGGDAELPGRGVAVGPPAYMAPEQARGERVDPRSDLFSLGCVLYPLATGRPPPGPAGVAGTAA